MREVKKIRINILKDLGCDKYNVTIQNLLNFVCLKMEFIMETVIITTLFHPDEFGKFYNDIDEVVKEKVYILKLGNAKFTYIRTDAGESIGDLLIAVSGICKRIIFVGAVGALHPEIYTGDIIISEYSMQSMSFMDQVRNKEFSLANNEKFFPDAEITCELKSICEKTCEHYKTQLLQIPICSISSFFTELKFIDQIVDMGFKVIEMETALLFAISNYFGIQASAIMQVSDNFATSTPLLGNLNMKEIKKCYFLRQTQWNKIMSEILLLYSK